MGKKFLLIVVLFLILTGSALARDLVLSESIPIDALKKLPNAKMGAVFSVPDNEWDVATMYEVAAWRGLSVDVGYANEDKLLINTSIALVKLEDLGIDLPIIDLVNLKIGYFYSIDRLFDWKSDETHGFSLTALEIKF